MCNSCQSCCGSNCGCGSALARAIDNLFSSCCSGCNLCASNRSGCNNGCGNCGTCPNGWYNASASGFGSCGSLNACSDAYYARQYALVYNSCCNNGNGRSGNSGCNCCNCRYCCSLCNG